MNAGSQCWHTVGLVFMEATAHWYAITQMSMHMHMYWYTAASYYLEVGCAMPQPLAAGYLPQWPGSDARPFCGKSVGDRVTWDTFYSEYFGLAPVGIIPSVLHTHSFIHH